MKRLIWVFSILLLLTAGPGWAGEKSNVVMVVPLEGTVGTVMETYMIDVLRKAEEEAYMVVFELDTPGGLVSSMTEITKQITQARVPVVMWVYPSGARAASAGAFLVMASHIAAMAPGTRIGAAHPVLASGGDVDDTMGEKITNDLAAQMRSLAGTRGRNSRVAERMVTESLSLTAEEALKEGVIDCIASDVGSLLAAVDGRAVQLADGETVLDLSGYEILREEMPTRLKILEFISRPDIAYLLLVLGIYAIIFEVLSPGGFVMGTAGAIMVLLGAYGLRMLPLNYAGIILLVAGIVVMVVDLLVGGIGILSAFGALSLIVGSLIIYRAPGGELLRFSMTFLAGAIVVLSAFFAVAAWAVLRAMKRRIVSGQEELVGMTGKVVQDLNPEGTIFCHGEYWKAKSSDGSPIAKDEWVEVESVDGFVLIVRKSDARRN
ncbi:nodulation protein NfeD [Acetomicrobium hydrogeniformans]|uniref:Nodulation protein NfeD n=1 Tax=Acetomicrobium hydrogeniformans TaxID=649746 RepID=A0A7V6ZFR4_9BACT|nr:nodulation protein NfeD [Acetomicrobium hydrogeniformans]